MRTRREVIIGIGATAACGATGTGARGEAPVLTDDGLYRQPWFIESFLDIAEDIDAAHKHGKRFALIWELKGCPYCKETHLVNFARPDIADYVRTNFDILQLNIIGSRKVTDLDGKELTEKHFAAKYAVQGTPTLQFFPETAAGLAELEPAKREVARAAGYLRPDDFLAIFRFVRERAYRTGSFRDYLRAGK